MVNYVCGFMFSEDKSKVVLIEKNRPNWQEGKLNGVGGKVELFETAPQAMIREFKEETGVEVLQWNRLITLVSESYDFVCDFYFCFGNIYKCYSTTDEIIQYVDVNDLPKNVIPNLIWLIPMCLDPFLNNYSEILL